jgi:hypothetical protein
MFKLMIAFALLVWSFTASRKRHFVQKRWPAGPPGGSTTEEGSPPVKSVDVADGSNDVGMGVAPGVYVASGAPGPPLAWALSSVVGSQRQVVVNQVSEGPAIVVITFAENAIESQHSDGRHQPKGWDSAIVGRG